MNVKLRSVNQDNLSIIIQGPIIEGLTLKAVQETRNNFPFSEIVLSTYLDSNVADLVQYVDIIVTIEDPGLDNSNLSKANLEFNSNSLRMIMSSLNGVNHASRDFIIRLRSDTYISNNKIMEFYNKHNTSGTEFGSRILVAKIHDEKYIHPSYIGDWVQMGQQADIKKLYSSAMDFFLLRRYESINQNFYINNGKVIAEIILWYSLFDDFGYLENKENFREFININITLLDNTNNRYLTLQKYPKMFRSPLKSKIFLSHKQAYEHNQKVNFLEFVLANIIRSIRFLNHLRKISRY